MKQNASYNDLMKIDQDIKYQMSSSPAFVAFNHGKIKKFREDNIMRLKILEKTINELMESHVKKDSKGVFEQIVMPEGIPNRWNFISEENAAVFNKDLEAFLKKEIQISI